MTLHSIYSASAAGRWFYCVGSIAMSRGIHKRSGAAAREGTAGHTLGERCLRDGWEDPIDAEGEVIEVEGDEIEVSADLAMAVQKYVDYVRGISGIKFYEVRTYYGELIGVPPEEAFGTADALALDGTILHVIDAKFGRRYVNPQLNKQLMLYAAGAVAAIEAVGETVTEVILHICQPRVTAEPAPYCMLREELAAVVAEFEAAATRAEEAQLLFQPAWARDGFSSVAARNWVDLYLVDGESQCQWCPAAAVCPKLRATVDDFLPSDEEDFDVVNILQQTDPEFIAEGLRKAPLLKIWMDAIEHEAFSRLTMRKAVPGFKLVTGREGNRKWRDPEEVLEAFSELEKEDLFTEKLKTPAQLEKALKKNPLKSKITELTHRNPARPTMAPKDDPRPEWVEAAGADEFDVVVEPDDSLA